MDKKSDVKHKLLDVNMSLDKVSLDDLDDNIRIINRRFNYSLKNKVMNEVSNGKVIPLFNTERLPLIPKAIPVWLYSLNGTPVALVNLSRDARKTKDGNIEIDNRTLFAHLQAGTILRECYYNWNKVSMNTEVLKSSMLVYTKLFSKVLDKMYGLSLNKLNVDKANYCIAKFFLTYVMEKAESETVNNMAYLACFNDSTKKTIMDTDMTFDDKAYKDFKSFIKELSTLDGLGKLNMRTFLQEWMILYGESTIISLEYYPLFCAMIFSSMLNAHVNKEFAIESVASKDSTQLYNELARILR